MDAILFSANPNMVEMDDAINHLENHKELYWSIGVPITGDKFSFPILGFIHLSGSQVEYRALISEIIPFSSRHYDDPAVKPEAWRQAWKKEPTAHAWKSTIVMTEIVPFSFDTHRIEKYGGGSIKHAPQGYVRVIPPNQSRESSPPLPLRAPIDEKNLGNFVVQQLDAIEAGLCLINREVPTPAGRLDLLCQDALGNYVVVELKKSRGTDQVIGQILRYMGWVKEKYPTTNVRGIVLVGKIDETLRYALKAAPCIEAKEFKLSIQ